MFFKPVRQKFPRIFAPVLPPFMNENGRDSDSGMENTEETPVKERHGCLTAWLILLIAGNAVLAALNLSWKALIDPGISTKMQHSMVVLAVLGFCNAGFAFALFRWKLWGFYGIVVTGILAFMINLNAGIAPIDALPGLIGVVVLFAILQIRKNDVSAWDQMEKRVRREDRGEEKE